MFAQQLKAANPLTSSWVKASAGTGKTKVLTDRVLRLLLAGNKPAKILCLTFTKAAATEMATRINKELSDWAIINDEDLSDRLEKIMGNVPNTATLHLARQLFLTTLDSPDSLEIQTIHAFCQALIQQFPLEAGLSMRHEVIDDNKVKSLLQEAKLNILDSLKNDDNHHLTEAVKYIAWYLHEQTLDDLISEIINNQKAFLYLFSDYQNLQSLIEHSYQKLGVIPDEDISNALKVFYTSINEQELRKAAELMLGGSNEDTKKANCLLGWFNLSNDEKVANFDVYKDFFLTQKNQLRKSLITKTLAKKYPEIEQYLQIEQDKLLKFYDYYNSIKIAHLTKYLLHISYALLTEYIKLKRYNNLLDYDDLISITHELLKSDDTSQWILYKLEGGIDHILIDEAQDTSPKQWQIIQNLVTEFFVTEYSMPRTLFVVGDEKQSIFSFQGANPLYFSYIQDYFNNTISNNGFNFNIIDLPISFRSTPPVLTLVDRIFNKPEIRKFITHNESCILHKPYRQNAPGSVTVWPLTSADLSVETDSWELPIQYKTEETSEAKLAEDIVMNIKSWLDNKRILKSKNRPIVPGDIMILVRRRRELSSILISKFKKHHIPVAGLDRLKLNDNLAIMDLIALGRFLMLPNDDYSLACILKSPLIGLTEDELFVLSVNRGENSLWDSLKDVANNNPSFNKAFLYLEELLTKLCQFTPYELYSYVIDTKLGRNNFLMRLGNEVLDPINSFLDILLEYEAKYTQSLQGFLEFFCTSNLEIKRDLEHGIDQIRIMTIHSAKGLQAPIVFLPDTTFALTSRDLLLWSANENLVFLPGKSDNYNNYCYGLKNERDNKEQEEDLRLLYVALTRAEDELIICGVKGKKNLKENCWYNIIEDAISTLGQKRDDDSWYFASGKSEDRIIGSNCHPIKIKELPSFINNAVSIEKVYTYLAPTISEKNEKYSNSLLSQSALPLIRGKLLHKLFQCLPKIQVDDRLQFFKHFFQQNYHPSIDDQVRQEIIDSSIKLLDSPHLKHLFATNAQQEVPIIGILNEEYIVSGRIDHLIIDDEVKILDYKTTKQVAHDNNNIPVQYLKQLSIYRNLLRHIYPDKKISCAIIWTADLTVMSIDDNLLDNEAVAI